jgi:nucleoside-diphosphate-sugar epimerase
MLQRAARAGLASVALCPPNIGGPYSLFLMALLSGLRRGRVPLVDDGAAPCNLVDVDNLVLAIELALEGGSSDGRRLFITDAQTPTWAEVLAELRPLLPPKSPPVPNLSAVELRALLDAQRPPSPSLSRTIKHLISGDVRAVLRRDPLLARVDSALRSAVTVLGAAAEDRIRLSIEAQARGKSSGGRQELDLRLASQQLRKVVHSSALAAESLGYRPRHGFAQSMKAFRDWYSCGTGADSPFADLYARVPN